MKRTMSGVKVITENGRDIIVSDFSNVENTLVILDGLDVVEKIISERDKPYCTLYIITGTYMDARAIARAKELSKFVDSTNLSRGSATVGVDSRSKRIIGNFLKPSMYFAKDMDDALAYLTDEKRWRE